MTKLLLIPNKKMLDINCDAFLLGIKDLSVNMPEYFTLEEIKKITKTTQKEIFIAINKNMHSNDLYKLKETLMKLEKLNIRAVIFYDIAVLNIVKKFNIKINLAWGQEHLTTNYETINYWLEKGVNYTLLSSEISKKEILTIKQNTLSKLIVPVIGYLPMFVSRRHLVKNYLKQFNLDDNSKINYIEKEGKIYPIVDEHVTTVYTNSYLNGIKEYLDFKQNKIEYILINSFLISESNIKEIINMFKNITEKSKDEYFLKLNNILNNNTDTFFLHKETIYKVK